jgi:hypothetical protein
MHTRSHDSSAIDVYIVAMFTTSPVVSEPAIARDRNTFADTIGRLPALRTVRLLLGVRSEHA